MAQCPSFSLEWSPNPLVCVLCVRWSAAGQVVAVEYPELLPLCSLDALCVARLSSAVMQHFDSNGVLDTSLPLDPLKDLLSHGLVEAGPGPVRVQAALEVAVYATIMTPLQPTGQRTTWSRQSLSTVLPCVLGSYWQNTCL